MTKHFHFIGIGGIGMSAIALILKSRGYSVSGSDQSNSSQLKVLNEKGILIFKQQTAENIKAISKENSLTPIVIKSTAIPSTNPELIAAKQAELEILHRSDILAQLIEQEKAIAVAGSHGKTTTSTILTTLLACANQDPTAIIGGVIPYFNSNSHPGTGGLLVAEADESDGSLVKFKPKIGLITNLELDHTDHYENLQELISTFKIFANGCEKVIANNDCQNLKENLDPDIWWSIKTKKDVHFSALPIAMDGSQTIADFFEDGQFIDQIKVPIPGTHNLSNTVAAIAACRHQGIQFQEIQKGLASLKCPKRRFEFLGTWKGRLIVDDYAHHPTEVLATLKIARLIVQNKISQLPRVAKRVVVIFQPHRYSRTKQFLNEFAHSLQDADQVIFAPIYAAGERPIPGITNDSLPECLKLISPKTKISRHNSLDDITNLMEEKTKESDIVLLIGAGNINTIWEKLHTNNNG